MKFDDFIQCCVMLKSLTDAFRKHDHQQSGTVTINYEQVIKEWGQGGGNLGIKGVGKRGGGKRDSQGGGNFFLQHCTIFHNRKSTRWELLGKEQEMGIKCTGRGEFKSHVPQQRNISLNIIIMANWSFMKRSTATLTGCMAFRYFAIWAATMDWLKQSVPFNSIYSFNCNILFFSPYSF